MLNTPSKAEIATRQLGVFLCPIDLWSGDAQTYKTFVRKETCGRPFDRVHAPGHLSEQEVKVNQSKEAHTMAANLKPVPSNRSVLDEAATAASIAESSFSHAQTLFQAIFDISEPSSSIHDLADIGRYLAADAENFFDCEYEALRDAQSIIDCFGG